MPSKYSILPSIAGKIKYRGGWRWKGLARVTPKVLNQKWGLRIPRTWFTLTIQLCFIYNTSNLVHFLKIIPTVKIQPLQFGKIWLFPGPLKEVQLISTNIEQGPLSLHLHSPRPTVPGKGSRSSWQDWGGTKWCVPGTHKKSSCCVCLQFSTWKGNNPIKDQKLKFTLKDCSLQWPTRFGRENSSSLPLAFNSVFFISTKDFYLKHILTYIQGEKTDLY